MTRSVLSSAPVPQQRFSTYTFLHTGHVRSHVSSPEPRLGLAGDAPAASSAPDDALPPALLDDAVLLDDDVLLLGLLDTGVALAAPPASDDALPPALLDDEVLRLGAYFSGGGITVALFSPA